MVVTDIEWPKSLGEYFDSKVSPLNPYNKGKTFFIYGTFPVFLTKFVGDVAGINGYNGYYLAGRALSGIFDIFTIIVLFFIAKELFNNTKTALLSSFLLGISAIHIQQSHFFTTDTFATFFMVLSFYFLTLLVKREKWYYFLLLGMSWGFALASKPNSILFAPMVFIGLLMVLIHRVKGIKKTRISYVKLLSPFAAKGLFIIFIAFFVYRVIQPYTFTGPGIWGIGITPYFISSFETAWQVQNSPDFPPSVYWVGRSPFTQILNLTLWGFGIPLSILVWSGFLLAVYRLTIKAENRLLLVVLWIIFVIALQSMHFTKYLRYILSVTPFLALLGAYFLTELAQNFRDLDYKIFKKYRKTIQRHGIIIKSVAIILILLSSLWAMAFTNVYLKGVSRIKASEWIYENVPAGSTIANEHWDDGLPLLLNGMSVPAFKREELTLYDADSDAKIEKLSWQLSRIDYIFISSSRLYKSIPQMPDKYPLTIRYYELLFNSTLGFRLEKVFTNYPSLFGIEINDDEAEESITVYDHPKVLIFKKENQFSSEEIMDLIKGYQ